MTAKIDRGGFISSVSPLSPNFCIDNAIARIISTKVSSKCQRRDDDNRPLLFIARLFFVAITFKRTNAVHPAHICARPSYATRGRRAVALRVSKIN